MKYLFVAALVTEILFAGEIDRMESIVADIERLRANYDLCVKRLEDMSAAVSDDEYKMLYREEQERNTLLQEELKALKQIGLAQKISEKPNEYSKYELKIKELERKNKKIQNLEFKYNQVIQSQREKIKHLQYQLSHSVQVKVVEKDTCKDENLFPQLIMKDEFIEAESEVDTIASTYRLTKKSRIYNDINGDVVDTWQGYESFTSKRMSEHWLKISGYFIDNQWVKATRDLWIEKRNTMKR